MDTSKFNESLQEAINLFDNMGFHLHEVQPAATGCDILGFRVHDAQLGPSPIGFSLYALHLLVGVETKSIPQTGREAYRFFML